MKISCTVLAIPLEAKQRVDSSLSSLSLMQSEFRTCQNRNHYLFLMFKLKYHVCLDRECLWL